MKSITPLTSSLARATVIAAIVICPVSRVWLSAVAQSPVSSTTVTNRALKQPSELSLLLVFYGYPQIGVPRNGIGIITDEGLSDIHDVTFLRSGGELSPDGRLVAYDNCSSPNRGIYIAERDGSKANRVIALNDYSCVLVRWSPDATKLSYASLRDNSLHVVDLASKREEVIANTEGAGWHSWSPAGNEIVYERGTGKTGRLLYVSDLHGNNRQITFPRDFSPCEWQLNLIDTWAPAWSARADKIAFTQCGSLFVISPSGKDLRQLTSARYISQASALPITPAYSPRWSPDGRWIIFIGQMFVRSSNSMSKRQAHRWMKLDFSSQAEHRYHSRSMLPVAKAVSSVVPECPIGSLVSGAALITLVR